MNCKDCIHYKNERIDNYYKYPAFRNKDGNKKWWKGIDVSTLSDEVVLNTFEIDKDINIHNYSEGQITLVSTRKFGECLIAQESDVQQGSDNVFADASDTYNLTVYVGENFGCIHFINKQEDTYGDKKNV